MHNLLNFTAGPNFTTKIPKSIHTTQMMMVLDTTMKTIMVRMKETTILGGLTSVTSAKSARNLDTTVVVVVGANDVLKRVCS